MILRDLSERSVGLGEDGGDLRERGGAHAGPAIFVRHRDREQPRLRDAVELGDRQKTQTVAFRGAGGDLRGDFTRGGDSFRVGANTMGRLRAGRQYRRGLGDGSGT